MTEEKPTLTPIEAINEFYRLKDKYETSYYEKYVKPIINSSYPKKQKRVNFSKLPKPECINCKRNVGTIFTAKYNKPEYVRQFIAKCGDFQDPCPLDIQINYGFRETFSKYIASELGNIDILKLEIIKEKNNALFFNKDVIKSFEDITSELKVDTELAGKAIETNILKNDNPEKHALLKQTIDEFGKGFIMPFKQMIQEFKETNNELILNQAVNFYINEMMPKLKDIQELKYEVNFVEYYPKEQLFKLIQFPTSLESNETGFKEDDKVVKFIKGVKKDKKSKSKTKKVMEVVTTKTRKNRPTGDLVVEEDVEEVVEENPLLPLKFGDNTQNNKPKYDVPEGVKWDNPRYNDVWALVPRKIKYMLLSDHEWLEEYMDKCVSLKQKGKPCNLFLPKQTKFPPDVEGGKDKPIYDFGVKIINDLFNKQEKVYKDNVLTLYSTKDGVKNYDMLKDTIIALLEKEDPDFNKGYF
jgi:hypothetical protein